MTLQPGAPALLQGPDLDEAVRGLPRPPGAALLSTLHGPASATLPGGAAALAVRLTGAIAWQVPDGAITRVHVAGVEQGAVSAALRALPEVPRAIVDVVARRDREVQPLTAALAGAGFARLARYVRIACRALPRARPLRAPLRRLAPDRGDALWAALRRDFDERLDHLPDRAACDELARGGQVLLAHAGAELDAYVVYRVAGKAFDFAYLFNRTGDPFAVDELLRALYQDLRDRQLTRGTAWVDERKPDVLALHARFGLVPDGLVVDLFERVTPRG